MFVTITSLKCCHDDSEILFNLIIDFYLLLYLTNPLHDELPYHGSSSEVIAYSGWQFFFFSTALSYPTAMLSRSYNYFTKEILMFVSLSYILTSYLNAICHFVLSGLHKSNSKLTSLNLNAPCKNVNAKWLFSVIRHQSIRHSIWEESCFV